MRVEVKFDTPPHTTNRRKLFQYIVSQRKVFIPRCHHARATTGREKREEKNFSKTNKPSLPDSLLAVFSGRKIAGKSFCVKENVKYRKVLTEILHSPVYLSRGKLLRVGKGKSCVSVQKSYSANSLPRSFTRKLILYTT